MRDVDRGVGLGVGPVFAVRYDVDDDVVRHGQRPLTGTPKPIAAAGLGGAQGAVVLETGPTVNTRSGLPATVSVYCRLAQAGQRWAEVVKNSSASCAEENNTTL
jgi:hypothetical protein